MNTRALSRDQVFVPESGPARSVPEAKDEPAPEEILFDKADQAEASEEMEQTIESVTDEIRSVEAELKAAPAEVRAELEERRRQLEARRSHLSEELDETKNGPE